MIAAIAAAVLLGGLVVFQIGLALGAPWGRAAFGGYTDRPGVRLRAASGVAVVVWSGAVIVVLGRAGILTAPLPTVLIWVVVALSALGIVANAITRSRLERAIWLPFSIVVTALCVVVALT